MVGRVCEKGDAGEQKQLRDREQPCEEVIVHMCFSDNFSLP